MDPRKFLRQLETDPGTDSLVHVRELPARKPVIEPFPDGLPELLVARLGLTGGPPRLAPKRWSVVRPGA